MTAEEARTAIHLLARAPMHPSNDAPIHLCTHAPTNPPTQADVYEELSNPWGDAMQCNDEMEQLSARATRLKPKASNCSTSLAISPAICLATCPTFSPSSSGPAAWHGAAARPARGDGGATEAAVAAEL